MLGSNPWTAGGTFEIAFSRASRMSSFEYLGIVSDPLVRRTSPITPASTKVGHQESPCKSVRDQVPDVWESRRLL